VHLAVPVGSSGLHFNPTRSYKYSYEAEVTLNHADLASDDKTDRSHADIGKSYGHLNEF